MAENIMYYHQFMQSYDPTYSQPPILIAPYSYNTTVPYSTCQYGYYEQGVIPNYLFGSDRLNVPLYNCVPVDPADALWLARQRAQDFADYLCKKYSMSEVKNTHLSDLPDHIIENILQRIGAYEILVNAQRVCKAWRKICKDPAMWRVIYMENFGLHFLLKNRKQLKKMCRQAIELSQGQLVDIKIEHIASDGLFKYLAARKRSSQLRRLQITHSIIRKDDSWINLFQKSPLLQEISIISTIRKESVSNAGQYCLQLKSFKYREPVYHVTPAYRPSKFMHDEDHFVITIAKSMPHLRHLELIGSEMTNRGLQAILDGCPHLVSLDLRRCFYINLDSSCGMLCKERIQDLRLPYDRYETPESF